MKQIVGYRVTAHLDDGAERGYLTEQRGGGFSWKWHVDELVRMVREARTARDIGDG